MMSSLIGAIYLFVIRGNFVTVPHGAPFAYAPLYVSAIALFVLFGKLDFVRRVL